MCERSPSILKKLCDHSSYIPDFTVGTEVTELRNLNAIGIIGSQGGRNQIIAPIGKVKVGMESQSNNHHVVIPIVIAIPDVVTLLKQINNSLEPGMQLFTWPMPFLHPIHKVYQTQLASS